MALITEGKIEDFLSPLEIVKQARVDLDNAEQNLRTNAKTAINTELKRLFSDDTVETVQWSQRESEYNDEGMYDGVHGPVLNLPRWEEDRGNWAYGYSGQTTDPILSDLSTILASVGAEILSDLYGDAAVVTVTRGDGAVVIETEDTGW